VEGGVPGLEGAVGGRGQDAAQVVGAAADVGDAGNVNRNLNVCATAGKLSVLSVDFQYKGTHHYNQGRL
jgi:hypothetical protein